MTNGTPKKPGRTAETEAREAERKKRLAAALRDNLKRRKAPAGSPPKASGDMGES